MISRERAMTFNLGEVLAMLVTASMKGEPDHVLIASADSSTFSWVMMFIFGIVVVLLLLNLLIARFAKTFDMVYENVDANFKVAFARVVLECRAKELLPPPLNLLRMFINWSRLGVLGLARRGDSRDSSPSPSWPWQTLNEEEEEERPKLDKDFGGGVGDSERREIEHVASQVNGYIRRSFEIRHTLPAQVADYVVAHQHDIGLEDQWRTEMARQISHVASQVASSEGEIRREITAEMLRLRHVADHTRKAEVAEVEAADARSEAAESLRSERLAARSERLADRLEVVLPAMLDHAAQAETFSAQLDRRLRQLELSVERQLANQQRALDTKLERLGAAGGSLGAEEAPARGTVHL